MIIHPLFEKTLVEDDTVAWEQVEPKIRRKVMSFNHDIMLAKVAFVQGGIGAMHHHPHLQMSYIASGVFEITISGEAKILRGGMCILYRVMPYMVRFASKTGY